MPTSPERKVTAGDWKPARACLLKPQFDLLKQAGGW